MVTIVYKTLPKVRRTHRQRRAPLLAYEIARLLVPAPPRRPRLRRRLAAIWGHFGGEIWTVTDLGRAGLVEPAEAHRLGHELGRALRRGGQVGDYTLIRLDAEDRGVRLWRLDRV